MSTRDSISGLGSASNLRSHLANISRTRSSCIGLYSETMSSRNYTNHVFRRPSQHVPPGLFGSRHRLSLKESLLKKSENMMSTSCPDKNAIINDNASPASPVNSICSIESDALPSQMASLASSYRRLTEEHERLQNDYCKLRQQILDESSKNLPEDGYKSEVTRLQEEVHRLQRRLVETTNLGLAGDPDKLTALQRQIASIEEEARETRENLDFISNERDVFAEQVKELEQALSCEKEERKAEKESLQDLASRSQTLYEKVLTKNERIKSLEEQLSQLQVQVDQLKREKNELTLQLIASDCEKVKQSESQLKNELNQERERNLNLEDEMKSLRERLRVSEAVNCELKKQLTSTVPVTSGPGAILQPASASFATSAVDLRRELKSARDAVASREVMIQKLNDKYTRHRQVWEENERRANDEIKKLDAMLDQVVATISPCAGDNPSLQRLLDELTRDAQGNLTSTFV